MRYQNPILYADYSDPDVIRVGADYYMVASSFTYLPGVPLLHSRDMVHWELINHCVPALPFAKYDRPSHGSGTWAPSIRYRNGVFFVFVPLPDEGILVARSEDPRGTFRLNMLCEVKGWIDPCPLWDDDGRAYMVFAYAGSRCGIRHRLDVVEIDPACTRLLGRPGTVFDGTLTAPTTEGPKFYKHDGWYLILAPSGGVATGWQAALRSRSVWGPYEYRVVMRQGNTAVNGPHQGGWVTDTAGRHWFLHFQDVHELGRITHLQPMEFRGGWPVIGLDRDGDGVGEPVTDWDMPAEGQPRYEIAQSDDFRGPRLGLQWQWQANPREDLYSLGSSDGLRLFCKSNGDRENLLWYAPNVLTQIPQHPTLRAVAKVRLSERGAAGDLIALGVLGHGYGYLGLQRTDGGFRLALYRGEVTVETFAGAAAEILAETVPWQDGPAWLCLEIFPDKTCGFSHSADGVDFTPLGERFPLRRGTWTGAKLCLWGCNRDNRPSEGFGACAFIHITGTA